PDRARFLDRPGSDLCNQQRLLQWRLDDESVLIGACVMRPDRHRNERGQRQDAVLGRRGANAARGRNQTLGCDDANAVTADRVEYRFDVDEAQPEWSGCDKVRFRPCDWVDTDLGRHTAPGERPCAAGTVCRYG